MYFIPDRADERFIYNYIITFSKSDPGVEFFRYAGFFDEPGAMAYWGLFTLVINKLFVNDRKLEMVLMIALLLTFSMGYYIQLSIYLMFFRMNSKNIGKSILTIAMIVGLFLLFDLTKDSMQNEIYDATVGRFEDAYDQGRESGNMLDVDSRGGHVEMSREAFLNNPWFGTADTEDAGGNNVYESLSRYGIIGCMFILYPFWLLLIWGIKDKEKDLLKVAIIFILGFTHRPFHANLLTYFILYSIIIMYAQSRKKLLESVDV